MDTTNKARQRGRPRRFNPDEGIAMAQNLFHAHGYDAVSVSDITEALGINPPSFYAAFGNKAELYARVLERYSRTNGIPLSEILRPDRPVAEALTALLEEAVRRYAATPETGGCLVLEGMRCNDATAREVARCINTAAEDLLHDYIAARHPEQARALTDFICTTLSGLSAKARNGHSLEQLLATARLTGLAVTQSLAAEG